MLTGFQDLFADRKPVIAALHLPPFPGSQHGRTWDVEEIVRFAVENTALFVENGVDAVFLQEGSSPAAGSPGPEVAAILSVVGAGVRRVFPDVPLGVIIASHGAATPLAVAKAVGAQFVRLKVFVGAMVKANGILQGCAYEAVQYRARIGAQNIAILADVYDRAGSPLGAMDIEEVSRWAVRYGADALVLTGHDFNSSLDILSRVRMRRLGVPLLLGGGATSENVAQALEHADGVIVSTSLRRQDGSQLEREAYPWDGNAIRRFTEAARQAV